MFRIENESARRRSNRARRSQQNVIVFGDLLDTTASFQADQLEPAATPDSFWDQYMPWLNASAQVSVPEPLRRDLSFRAVDRFFINWILYPANSGLVLGHLHTIPALYQSTSVDSVLHYAVRAVAFADMPNNLGDEGSTFHTKARRSYGAALNRMRELASDSRSVVDDHVLAALLLIDNFEVSTAIRATLNSLTIDAVDVPCPR